MSQALEDRFTKHLSLKRSPVAVTFSAQPPTTGVRKFIGEVPSSCSFWRLAAEAPRGKSAFFTEPGDHYNCPIGAYTHHQDLPASRAKELDDVLGFMANLGYVSMAEVPQIPRWSAAGQYVTYSRLGDSPGTPDVVVFTVSAQNSMLISEAAHLAGCHSGTGAMLRPTCMALPATAQHGTTTSLGCVGNRVYTELSDGDLYAVVRGSDLEKVADALDRIVGANKELHGYHSQRKTQLDRPQI